jgi:type I restriction enzyme R subunit
VQTLSRLNRIHPNKADTFVLDFRNETDEIVKAFEPYYGRTVAPPTDPNLLFDTRRRLDDFDVLRPEEIEATVALLLAGDAKSHGKVYAALDPAVERFTSLVEEERLGFKAALDKFVRTYSFLSQVVNFGDSKLERDYIYCRALASRLRDAASVERLDLGTEVELTHLKTEMTFEGSLSLDADTGEVKAIFGEGRGRQSDPQLEHLSEIVCHQGVRRASTC